MAALVTSNQNSATLFDCNAQNLEFQRCGALDARVEGAAQKVIAEIHPKCNLPPASSKEGSFMEEESVASQGSFMEEESVASQGSFMEEESVASQGSFMEEESVASLCAEFGLGSIIEEQTVRYPKPSSEEEAWLRAYEGVSANSGTAPLVQAEEYRYPKGTYSEECSFDLSDVDGLLKEMERGVIGIDEERELRIAKARQLEQGRLSEPIPTTRLKRIRVVPISPLVPKGIQEVFKRTPFNGLSLVTGPCIHPKETLFGDWQPKEHLAIRQKK